MAFLIAVAGLSGAGKTTAIRYLKDLRAGEEVYLGGMVLKEVRARGLSPGSESERVVREDVRRQLGPAAYAVLAKPLVENYLNSGVNVLVDAIFVIEEYRTLQRCSGVSKSVLLAINASFETRCGRVNSRAERQLTQEELKARDEFEIAALGTELVMAGADYKIVNEGPIQNFRDDLDEFWKNAGDLTSE